MKRQKSFAESPQSWATSRRGSSQQLASERGAEGYEQKREGVAEKGYWDGTARLYQPTLGASRKKGHRRSGSTKSKRQIRQNATATKNRQEGTWWKGADY